MTAIVKIKNLFVRYGLTEALQNISCEIEKGDFVGLVGPNGSGKTTLVKAILGLVPINSGKIHLWDKEIKEFSDFQKIGYLPQKQISINPLFPANAEEVVLLGFLARKKRLKKITKKDKEEIEILLEQLEIKDLKNKLFSQLSGGQQQKVLLARALVNRPEILILDEPSTALDTNSRERFFTLLKKINDETKTTIILITHDTGYVGKYANKLLYIDQKLLFFGKITDFCPSQDFDSCFIKTHKHIIWHQHN